MASSAFPRCLPADGLTKVELARETRRTRIVEIERTTRGTAYRNMLKRYSAEAALEHELERLFEGWSK
jgi:hypothetical protein